MPSANKQINVRADRETLDLIARLLPVVRSALGLSRISQSDLFRLGLNELAKKYLTGPAHQPAEAPAATRTRKARRGQAG